MTGSYGGVYLSCVDEAVAGYLAAVCDPGEVLQFALPATHNLWHLPIPSLPPLPPVIPNVLSWPADASRFATYYALVTDEDMATLRPLCFTVDGPVAQTLLLTGDDVEEISTELFALAPRPLAQISGLNGLWLLPLVDDRYFWWMKSANIEPAIYPRTTWADYFSLLATALGVSISVTTVPSAYSYPSLQRFTAYQQPLPLLLDAAARTVGMRVVRDLDGAVTVQDYAAARAIEDIEVDLALGDTRYRKSGGAFHVGELKRGVPDTVTVVFPRLDGNIEVQKVHTVDVTLATLALSEYTANGTISAATDTEPIVCTSAAHGLVSGDLIDVSGGTGDTSINGTWAITVVDVDTFSLDGSVGAGTYDGGSATWDATVAGYDGSESIAGDLPATFASDSSVSPTNTTALSDWAEQAATDWYLWQLADGDWHMQSLANWIPNGLVDLIEWRISADRCSTRASRGPYNDVTFGLPWNLDNQGQTTLLIKVTSLTPTAVAGGNYYPAREIYINSTTLAQTNGDVCWYANANGDVPDLNSLHLCCLFGLDTSNPPVKVYIDSAAGTGITGITVTTVDGTPSYASTTTLKFDEDDGFSLSQPVAGVVRVDILPASATQAGIVNLSAQTMGDGEKTFTQNLIANESVTVGQMVWYMHADDPLLDPMTWADFYDYDSNSGAFDAGLRPGVARRFFNGSAHYGEWLTDTSMGDPYFKHWLYSSSAFSPKYCIRYDGSNYEGQTGTSGGGDTVTGGIITTLGSGPTSIDGGTW